MWYSATINAYDCLGQVVITATVRLDPDVPESAPRVVMTWVTQIEGVGEQDPRRWLGDALVGLLERV